MKSIRREMLFLIGAAALLLLLVCGFGLYFTFFQTLTSQFDSTLVSKTEALMTATEIDEDELEIDPDVQSFIGYGPRSLGEYFEIFTREGAPLHQSHSLGDSHLPRPEGFDSDESGYGDIRLSDGIPCRAYWATFTPSDSETPRFTDLRILVASERGDLDRTLKAAVLAISLFGGGAIVISLIILYFVVGFGLTPLDRLSNRVQKIDVRRLSERLDLAELPTELQGFGDKLNELLERLEASFSRERRFSSHAAHELRTPLAEIRAMVELGIAWPDEVTPTFLTGIGEAVTELEQLIERLSLLSRADKLEDEALEEIDLEMSVNETLHRLSDELHARSLEISSRIEPGKFYSDPILWRAILGNLCENAVSYSPEGSLITIEVSPHHLSVENEAPDLTEEDVAHMCERFWRKRETQTKGHHSGLGLSIVRSSVEHLKGKLCICLQNKRLQIQISWDP